MKLKPSLSACVQYGALVLWAAACFAFYQFFYPYHCFYKEQNQLFLLSADYVQTYFARPAWLASLVGEFLTQFYYYIGAGAALLTLSLLVLAHLLRRALLAAGVGRRVAFWLALALTTVEAVAHLNLAHQLATTLALAGGAATFVCVAAVASRLRSLPASVAFAVVAVGACHWLFGLGLWVFAALSALLAVLGRRRRAYGLLCCCLAVAACAPIAYAARHHYVMRTADALLAPGVTRLAGPDFALESSLGADMEYHFGNYAKVVDMVERAPRRTEQMLFFYNLAQAQRGQLPQSLLNFVPNQLGTFYEIGPSTPLLTIRNMNELYWAVGDMTFAERAAMMTLVFSRNNRNVRMVRRLAECNLVSGDTAAAEKYLRLLDQTLVHRRWAAHTRQNANRLYAEKRQWCNRRDTVTTSDNMHFLLMQLLDHNPANRMALDYLLCSDLLLKDIANFKRDYDRYCTAAGRRPTARLYQEALCIWLAGTQAPSETWQQYIDQDDVLRQFADYNQQRGSSRFARTYWYYFDKANVRAK